MKFKNYILKEINEMTKYSKMQKDNLSHVIINALMDPNLAKLLKKVKSTTDKENVTLTKKEANEILENLKRIRQIVIDLPVEEE